MSASFNESFIINTVLQLDSNQGFIEKLSELKLAVYSSSSKYVDFGIVEINMADLNFETIKNHRLIINPINENNQSN